jgi:hypothetical protein
VTERWITGRAKLRTAVVLTTIATPEVVEGYIDNARSYGHSDIGFIVIGDLKTPHEAARQVLERVRADGFLAEYWDIEEQKRWLARFPELDQMIPYNSDNRRNLGFLIALERGAEVIISTDDDNFATPDEDFFGLHGIVGETVEAKTVHSTNGWFNPCSLLEFDPPVPVYSRGYPFGKRWQDELSFGVETGRVAVNMGLWLGDPDVDAITRLALPVRSLRLKSNRQVMLGKDCYMPINTQNTAVHRDAMPAFYFVLQGIKIDGMVMDRYGDIWAGFFLNKAASHVGDRVTVGGPLVQHARNQHDLLRDLQNELWGMLLTEYLVPYIEEMPLSESTYCGMYSEMAERLKDIPLHPHPAVQQYLGALSTAMTTWATVCRQLLPSVAIPSSRYPR